MKVNSQMVPFGKYKDEPIEKLLADTNYREWLVNQPWFKDQYVNIYNIAMQLNTEDTPTPEHNAMQIKWMDKIYCKAFVEKFVEYEENELNIEFYPIGTVVFEGKRLHNETEAHVIDIIAQHGPGFSSVEFETLIGWDVMIRRDTIIEKTINGEIKGLYLNGNVYQSETLSNIGIELKPIIGDDYPNIIRKIKKRSRQSRYREYNVVVCTNFQSEVISLEQAKQFFRKNDIHLFLESDFEEIN